MSRIFWLASYPKSGNTWLRAFLTSLIGAEPLDINKLAVGTIAADRNTFDRVLTISGSDMTEAEVEYHRPEVYRRIAANSETDIFLKAHDEYCHTAAGEPLFPAEVSGGAVYLVRNPLDVVVSFAHHMARSVDQIVDLMQDDEACLGCGNNRLHQQLPQRLRSWSTHVSSWLDCASMPVHVMKYEDMHATPVQTFGAAVNFLGFQSDPDRLSRALAMSSFAELRRQEEKAGFAERSPRALSFFRGGRTGDWQNVLTARQVDRIVQVHGPVMRRLGYLEGKRE